MKIGLIDVDGHNYPNLPLMKISAWHKRNGDTVEWYDSWSGLFNSYDKVYLSKVFSFTKDYDLPIYAKEIIRGGTGYCIEVVNGKEIFHKEQNRNLPEEIEHSYPDYSLYPEQTKDTAYGFLTRGCPRGCDFCIVKDKEGLCSKKVADLSEFWNGQKNIVLCDPNILACKDWKDLLKQLEESEAWVDFNQGIDIRLMTEEKAIALSKIKTKSLHFAWDRYEDKDLIQPKFLTFKKYTKVNYRQLMVYCIIGDRERRILPQDFERIYWLRDNGYEPYVMIYRKDELEPTHELRQLQRYVNNKILFHTVNKFEEYNREYRRKI